MGETWNRWTESNHLSGSALGELRVSMLVVLVCSRVQFRSGQMFHVTDPLLDWQRVTYHFQKGRS